MAISEPRSLEDRIDVLQGELSVATWAIAQLFTILVRLAGDAEIRDILRERILSSEAPAGVNDSWRHGCDAFKDRLAGLSL